jgi:5-methylcytosine-specific restriction endonuclease McrA
MPYKNPEDKLAWQRANKYKAAEYKKRWMSGPLGQEYLAKQRQAMELQKEQNAERRLATRLENAELNRVKRMAKDRAYRLRQRAKALSALGNECMVCGMDDLDVLEFDHIEPIFRRTSGVRSKDSSREILRHPNPTEVFQLLCANCHAKKTRSNGEFVGPPGKGTEKNG